MKEAFQSKTISRLNCKAKE